MSTKEKKSQRPKRQRQSGRRTSREQDIVDLENQIDNLTSLLDSNNMLIANHAKKLKELRVRLALLKTNPPSQKTRYVAYLRDKSGERFLTNPTVSIHHLVLMIRKALKDPRWDTQYLEDLISRLTK